MKFVVIILTSFMDFFCGYAQNNIMLNKVTIDHIAKSIFKNQKILVEKDLDLNGKILSLPQGTTLAFNGGVIKNGIIRGNDTKIECKRQAFDNIDIEGSWNVPTIYSTWFKNLNKNDALKNVLALTNPNVKNKVIIAEGNYVVSVNKNAQACLLIEDNTEVVLNGIVTLIPNSFTNYYIIYAKGENIKIEGKGIIVGDKYSHLNTKGEWGMGINVSNAKNVFITGLTVKNCWGDCIYIGNNAEHVSVENCILDNGRRQGISVTSGNHIVLRNLTIENVGGTNPEYAIDIEPNKNEIVDKVLIENVKVNGCKGGFLVWGKAKDARVGKVMIKKCNISNTSKLPISIHKCNIVEIKDCLLSLVQTKLGIYCDSVDNVYIEYNRIGLRNDFGGKLKMAVCLKKMQIDNCAKKVVKNNKLVLINE